MIKKPFASVRPWRKLLTLLFALLLGWWLWPVLMPTAEACAVGV